MKTNGLFKKTMLAVAFVGMAAASIASQAAVINSLFQPGVNQIEDTDVERVLDAQGNTVTTGNLQVGDVLQSILRFNTANTTTISDALPAPYQLTAFSQLKVATISAPDANGIVSIGFQPVAADNVMVSLYERTSAAQPAFSQTIAPDTAISNVQAQTLIATFGIGNVNDFWVAQSFLDIAQVAALSSSDPQATAGNAGLSVLNNPGNLPIEPLQMTGLFGNLHDVVLNSSVYQLAPGVNSGWLVSSNTSAQFTVPEPAPLALIGLGLAALGLVRRRQKV